MNGRQPCFPRGIIRARQSRRSYNGYYPSLPSWRRGFDSLSALFKRARLWRAFLFPGRKGVDPKNLRELASARRRNAECSLVAWESFKGQSLIDASENKYPGRIRGMRKPRLLKEGALYHVSARANRKEHILDEEGMKDVFLAVVRRARKRYCFRIENFCVMGNHYHLMIRPGPRESLSRIMQWIMSVFAMTYNRAHGYSGHVWGERFFSKIIEGFREFLEIFRYIDRNPVDAGLVLHDWEWKHGGLWHDRLGYRHVLVKPPCEALLWAPRHELLRLPDRSP